MKQHNERPGSGDMDDPSTTAYEVFETEQPTHIDTGLLDQFGNPIRRPREIVKFGFVI